MTVSSFIDHIETVSNELRETAESIRAPRKKSPLVAKLLKDETVFIPKEHVSNENSLNKYYETARKLGYKLTKRRTNVNGTEGFLMWFTKEA